MSLIGLFFLFMYIGACTIGGGLVAITLMQQELIPRGLITSEEFFSMVAVSESTPGPIGVNMATYIGYKLYGVVGSIVVTTGIVLPSVIVILFIAKCAIAFQEKPLVKKSFYGLRAGAVGMIGTAFWQVLNISVFTLTKFKQTGNFLNIVDLKQASFFCFLTILIFNFKKIHPIIFVFLGGIFGIIFL